MLRITSILALLAAAIIGCKNNGAQTAATGRDGVIAMSQGVQSGDAGPHDAAPPQQYIYQVDVYQLAVPFGTYSANEEFWKRVDEQRVDPATYDILRRNGIRVGEASTSELEFFKKFMDVKPAMEKLSTTSPQAQNVQLEMKKDLPEQTIFQFDLEGTLSGKSYDGSTNIFNMSFRPTPREPGSVQVELCPVVRATKKHIEYTALNNETEIQYVNSEELYRLNLRVDIPKDHFFIVAPSMPEARWSVSVGHAFLSKDGHVEPQEQILLIIPNPVAVNQVR